MTLSLAQHTASVKDNAAARKRRRRAATGGASEDCFTCVKKNLKCDRRRPYCSQCLNATNGCSGYKTQLTWGVGVASRGKLRGLSLPVATAPPVAPVAREAKKASPSRPRANSTTPATSKPWNEHENHSRTHQGPIDIPCGMPHLTMAGSAPTSPYTSGFDFMSLSQTDSIVPMSPGSWNGICYSPDMMHADGSPKYANKFNLPLIVDSLSSSVDSASEVGYLSPLSQPYSRDELSFGTHGSNRTSMLYGSYSPGHSPQSPPSVSLIDHSRTSAPTSCPGLGYASADATCNLGSHLDSFDRHLGNRFINECESLSASGPPVYGVDPLWTPFDGWMDQAQTPIWMHERDGCIDLGSHVSHVPAQFKSEVMAGMPYLMEYYEKTMAPSMVYIDGPDNPFGQKMLRLALCSLSLQHAICALAACNLRMKRELSLGKTIKELGEGLLANKLATDGWCDWQQPSCGSLAEEFHHRNQAVCLLNQQLEDARVSRHHDSVLATMLVLCHYRMAESGVAKFHTQFAGVKRILAAEESQGLSRDLRWMETLFTFFDAISATINGREAQLAGWPGCKMLPVGAENLVGCERELFATIRSLGRLNVFWQQRFGRRASNMHEEETHQASGHGFDGNGYGTLLDDDDMVASAMRGESSLLDGWPSEFWQEWRDRQLVLHNWRFNAAAVAATLPGPPSPQQVRHLGYLSEAFRHAALLYMERLANPAMPSGHMRLHKLVSQVVCYVQKIDAGSTADKFLLWPLFVSGSECVNETEQRILRDKCRSIMSRWGYMNSLSALHVLEKLWAGDMSRDSRGSGYRGPFTWMRCFGGPRADAEWIMF